MCLVGSGGCHQEQDRAGGDSEGQQQAPQTPECPQDARNQKPQRTRSQLQIDTAEPPGDQSSSSGFIKHPPPYTHFFWK